MEAACVRPPQPVQPWTSKVKPMRLRPRIENPVNSSLVILPISVPSCIPYFFRY